MPSEDEIAVLEANDAFYSAFETRDAGAMERSWASDPCACVHPGWDPLVGREAVMDSWKRILDGDGAPSIRVESARVQMRGDVAIVLCIERLSNRRGGEMALLSATNVFVREEGTWRICHHHAGPVSRGEEEPSIPPSRLN